MPHFDYTLCAAVENIEKHLSGRVFELNRVNPAGGS